MLREVVLITSGKSSGECLQKKKKQTEDILLIDEKAAGANGTHPEVPNRQVTAPDFSR